VINVLIIAKVYYIYDNTKYIFMSLEFKAIKKTIKNDLPYIKDVVISDKEETPNTIYIDVLIDMEELKKEYDVDMSHIRNLPMKTSIISHIIDSEYEDIQDEINTIVKKIKQTQHIPLQLKSRKRYVINNYVIS
jgi:hypothetical protein